MLLLHKTAQSMYMPTSNPEPQRVETLFEARCTLHIAVVVAVSGDHT